MTNNVALTDLQPHIENVIRTHLPDESDYPSHIVEAMNYAMTAGGKRIRPTLMYLAYKAADNSDQNASDSSVLEAFMSAIEMIHTHSLIHDDLPALDNDTLRRGRPTVHVQFDESTAILAGDALLNYAYETVLNSFDAVMDSDNVDISGNAAESIDFGFIGSCQKAMRILATKTGINGMLGGQGLDVELSGKKISNEERDYIYEKKTSALIEAPLMIGATLAGAAPETVSKLEQAGRAVGLAFQVQDDILDAVGDSEKLGKEVHQDERNEKNTFVSQYGIEESRKFVKDKSEEAVRIIDEVLPAGPWRDKLTELIMMMVGREN